MSRAPVDIHALSVNREPRREELRLPRRWFSRLIVPIGLLAGFAGLAVYASWDAIVPAVSVSVVPVVTSQGTIEVSGQELFKANGWIEPRPFATDVPIQTEGMYRAIEVAVVPGDRVKKGQLLIRFDDDRAKLEHLAAQRRHDKRKAAGRAAAADLARAEVTARNAEVSIELTRQEGQAEFKSAEADLGRAQAAQKSAELAVKVEEDLLQSGAISSKVKLQQSQQQRDVAIAETKSLQAKLEKARVAASAKTRQAELAKVTADADVVSLRAKVDEATQEAADIEVEVRKAQLELDRTRLLAPIDGVVMQLNVRAGSVMGGKNTAMEHKDAAVTLYDPAKLQVRVEVPIAKFALVRPGQAAVVELEEVMPGVKIPGVVLSDTHFGNVSRNSVPVKVALPDQPAGPLRPEMIAAVRFIAAKKTEPEKTATVMRLIIPRKLVRPEGEQAKVWVLERGNRAGLRTIELVPGPVSGESVEVVSGLQPTDKLIATQLDQMKPGLRLKITGEER